MNLYHSISNSNPSIHLFNNRIKLNLIFSITVVFFVIFTLFSVSNIQFLKKLGIQCMWLKIDPTGKDELCQYI